MTHSVSIDSVVYGDQHGNVAFLDKAEGVIPPPNIRAGDSRHGLPVTSFEMIYLGRPNDVLTRALNHLYYQHRAAPRVTVVDGARTGDLRKQRAHPQEALAQLLGVRQQSVSRWASGACAPRLSWEQWGMLVKLVISASD